MNLKTFTLPRIALALVCGLWSPTNIWADGANDSFPSWSPDGSTIAFSSDRSGSIEIYTIRRDGSDLTRLTHTPHRDAHPGWSPDGRKIVFQSPRDGSSSRDVDLYLMAADGSGVQRLTRLDGFAGVPMFSPGGQSIVFQYKPASEDWDAERWQLWIMATDGSGLRQLTSDDADNQVPVFSPDGRQILYFSNRTGSNQLWRMSADGKDSRQLTSLEGDVNSGTFSPDGRQIAFVWARSSSTDDSTRDIYLMDADGSPPERVTRGLTVWGLPFFSPDGNHLLINATEDGRFIINVALVDGTAVRRLSAK